MKKPIEKLQYDWDEVGSHLLEQVVEKLNIVIEKVNELMERKRKTDTRCTDCMQKVEDGTVCECQNEK